LGKTFCLLKAHSGDILFAYPLLSLFPLWQRGAGAGLTKKFFRLASLSIFDDSND